MTAERMELIRRGNITRTEYRKNAETGCYLGNGTFGSVISGLGLNMSPELQAKYPKAGQSQFMHMKHWGRFSFLSEAMGQETTADYILPLFKIHWEKEPEEVLNYKQCQDFYDGTVETSYILQEGTKVSVLTWMDMVDKDLAGFRFHIERGTISIKMSVVTNFIPYAFLYKKKVRQRINITEENNQYKVAICCEDTENRRRSNIYFYTNAKVSKCEEGLCLKISEGQTELLISYGKEIKEENASRSIKRTKEKWHRIWKESAWFDFPEETAQKTWVRSLAYLLSSYESKIEMIQPTNGLTGNMFPFHFVQDMEYIAPALMMTGHSDIVKHWIEKFSADIEGMRKYAKRLWPEAEGIYPPWELPYGSIEEYHMPSVPVFYCYEPHNAGYLCRMAKEAAEFVNDREWAERHAYPLIREVCEFYHSFSRKQDDGMWHLQWYPCIGQDEAGGRNKSDYLCSFYSAKYSFQTAVELRLDKSGSYAEIIRDGLAFENLLSKRGIYHTCQGADDFGRQKHPVQLDGLAYFPVEKEALLPEKKAYKMRRDITEGAKESFYQGWTLGEFLLAGSNLKDTEGWKEDWSDMRKSDYTDTQWIQIYETSKASEKSFYITTHGMVLQSLIRNYVNDYWGSIEIASCPVFDGDVSFGGVRTRFGAIISGNVTKTCIHIVVEAERDCECIVNGELMRLKQGAKKIIKKELLTSEN